VRKSAAHLEARGVKDPLMFARPQLSTKRCWNAEQVEHECARVLTAAFDKGDATTAKAYTEAESALQGMTAFLKQAEATLALEAKLQMERDEKARSAPSTEGLPAVWGVDAYQKMHVEEPVQFRPPPAAAPARPEQSFEEELEAELDAALEARDAQFRRSFVTEVISPLEPLEKPESPSRPSDPATDDDLSDLADVDPPPVSNAEFDAHPLLAPDELDATLGDLPEPDVLILSDTAEDSLQLSAPQALAERAEQRASERASERTSKKEPLGPLKPRKPSVQRKIQDAQSFAKSRTSGKASPRRARPVKPA
jgi:hypothetical protein